MYGLRIKELRLEKELSQKQLAEKLQTTQKTISKYETEFLDLSTEMTVKFCKFFNVSTDYLLGVTDDYGAIEIKRESLRTATDDELKIIEDYRELNPSGKNLIKQTLKALNTATIKASKNKNA